MIHILAYLLVGIAAILNAVMDRLENESFRSSIFRNLNEKWWYKRISWVNKYKKIKIRIPYIWWTKSGKK